MSIQRTSVPLSVFYFNRSSARITTPSRDFFPSIQCDLHHRNLFALVSINRIISFFKLVSKENQLDCARGWKALGFVKRKGANQSVETLKMGSRLKHAGMTLVGCAQKWQTEKTEVTCGAYPVVLLSIANHPAFKQHHTSLPPCHIRVRHFSTTPSPSFPHALSGNPFCLLLLAVRVRFSQC
jgi:hypothetical protein